jgi:two-component system chemotaxis response regulator CheY
LRDRPDFARIPFVLVTSASERDTVQEAVRLGASGYVVKPFSVEEAKSRLEGIIQATWAEIAEDPAATLRRLSIPAPKLNVYYSAFRRQIDEALTMLREAPGSPTESVIIGKLDALQTGCLTLGLWHGARILDSLQKHPRPGGCLKDFLVGVGEVLDHQRNCVRDGTWLRQERAT